MSKEKYVVEEHIIEETSKTKEIIVEEILEKKKRRIEKKLHIALLPTPILVSSKRIPLALTLGERKHSMLIITTSRSYSLSSEQHPLVIKVHEKNYRTKLLVPITMETLPNMQELRLILLSKNLRLRMLSLQTVQIPTLKGLIINMRKLHGILLPIKEPPLIHEYAQIFPILILPQKAKKMKETYRERLQREVPRPERTIFEEKAEYRGVNVPEILLSRESKINSGFAKVVYEGPIYIIVSTAYGLDKIIELLCSLMLRIQGEGPPSTAIIPGIEVLSAQEWKTRRSGLIVLEESKGLFSSIMRQITSGNEELAREAFARIAREFYLQGVLRYIVIPVKSEFVEKTYNVLRVVPEARKVLMLKEAKLNHNQWLIACKTLFGFVDWKPVELLSKDITVEIEFEKQRLKVLSTIKKRVIRELEVGDVVIMFKNKMEEELLNVRDIIRKNVKAQYWPESGKEYGQKESMLHYLSKYVVFSHFKYNEGIEEENIKTECTLDDIKADVYIENKDLPIEIETFFGRGDPLDEIRSKITKYKHNGWNKLCFVIPNPQALIYAEDLLKIYKDYKGEMDIEFYVFDLTGDGSKLISGKKTKPGLIRLIDVVKLLREYGLGT